MAGITGECELTAADIVLVPDNPDDTLPPGYLIEDGASTGSCVNGMDDAECPPGCIPDPGSGEYPPGLPAYNGCVIYDATWQYGFADHFYLRVGNKIWADKQGEAVIIVDISDGTDEMVPYKSLYSQHGNYPEMQPPSTNGRFTGIARIGERIFIASDCTVDTNPTYPQQVIWIYDLDGNHLGYFTTPLNYNCDSRAYNNITSDGTKLHVIRSLSHTPTGATGVIFSFDFYGTNTDIYTEPYETIGNKIEYVNGTLITSRSGLVQQRALDCSVIKTLSRGTITNDNAWGAEGICVLRSEGLDDIFYVMGVTDAYNGTLPDYDRARFFDKDANFLYEAEISEQISSFGDYTAYPFAKNGYRFGNYFVVGSKYAYQTSSLSFVGTALIYDITTGKIVKDMYGTTPYPGPNGRIAEFSIMTKSRIWMFVGSQGNPGKIKECSISWV